MKKTLTALFLSLTLIPRSYAAAGPVVTLEDPEADWLPKVTVSTWANDGIAEAYKAGLVSPRFDLGDDYTRNISREQFARLVVEFAAAEKKITVRDMMSAHGIQLVVEDDTSTDDAQPDTPADTSSPDPEGGETTTPETTDPETVDPETTDPETADPETTDPETADPETTDPEATDPEGAPVDVKMRAELAYAVEPDDTANEDGGYYIDPAALDTLSPAQDDKTDEPQAKDTGSGTEPEAEAEPQNIDDVPTLQPEPQNIDDVPALQPENEISDVVNGSFSDTSDAYVELAAKLEIVQGSNGMFRPTAGILRAEAAAMLQRTLRFLGMAEADSAPQQFTDFYDIPRWAIESVKFVSGTTDGAGQPLMGGSGGKFTPVECYTIEQSILTILRMHKTLGITAVYEGWRDAPGYDIVSLTLTFGGDCTFGRGRDFPYEGSFDEMYTKHKGDLSYFFSGIPEFHDDDITMVNFEGTLTDYTKYANKQFVFKGPAEYAKILPAGSIDVVSVANNHSMDYLQRGFDDTVANLSPYVKVSGYSRLPIVTVKGVKIGFASNVGWSYDKAQRNFIDNAIGTLRAEGADIIVFNYHWGIERSYHSDETQQAIGHYCIDKGADFVIGHHPHVVQEVEVYKGKPIAYSLGNLVFGGNHNPAEKNCLIFRQNIDFDLGKGEVASMEHEALKYRVSSVNYRNDYHPMKAE